MSKRENGGEGEECVCLCVCERDICEERSVCLYDSMNQVSVVFNRPLFVVILISR